ncbi:tyrosine-type recombinase/integrase [Paenibacillus sp. NRS-1782]|uniref:tyrosine-type recombinase/integrase n=1 Tax=unclassified Paenibacillus TaxID=185978 RepID=UPI003D2D6437
MSGNHRGRRANTIAAVTADSVTKQPAESLDFDIAIASFIRQCRVKNLTDETLKYYRNVLRSLKDLMYEQGITRPIDVRSEHVGECILMRQESGVVDITVNTFVRGWRAFFNHAYNEGHITENVGAGIKLIKAERRVIETFTKDQLRRLLDAPEKTTFTGYRNYVVLLTLLDTMIRISELEGIRLRSINWRDRTITVMGKGRKERVVPFQNTLEKHLQEYINIRGPLDHDFLFVNIDNNPLKKRSIQQTIAGLGKEAGIQGVRCSPHTIRHTGAKMYIMRGGDVFSLQKILGHTSLDVVKLYVSLWGTDVAEKHRRHSPLEGLFE